MKKKAPELDFSPQANMLHLLKSAKSIAMSSPKRNTVLLQPSILDMMSGKGTAILSNTAHRTLCITLYSTRGGCDYIAHTYRGYLAFSIQSVYA